MKMVVGLSAFASEWPNKQNRTERGGDCPIFLNGPCVVEKGVPYPVYIGRCAPGVNAFCTANAMRRRSIPAVRANEHRRVDFATKILQKSRQYDDCAGHIVRKLTQEQRRLTTIHQHQFCERKVRRQSRLLRFLPAANFIKETRQTMNIAENICFRFGRSQQRAVLLAEVQTVNRVQRLSAHLLSIRRLTGSDKSVRK